MKKILATLSLLLVVCFAVVGLSACKKISYVGTYYIEDYEFVGENINEVLYNDGQKDVTYKTIIDKAREDNRLNKTTLVLKGDGTATLNSLTCKWICDGKTLLIYGDEDDEDFDDIMKFEVKKNTLVFTTEYGENGETKINTIFKKA